MKQTCEQLQSQYNQLFEVVQNFKRLDLKTERIAALKIKKEIEQRLSDVGDNAFSGVYMRKRLADKLGYVWISRFDKNGYARALTMLGGDMLLINRNGEFPFGKEVYPEAPVKFGYYCVWSQGGRPNVINEKGEIIPNLTFSSLEPSYRDSTPPKDLVVITVFKKGKTESDRTTLFTMTYAEVFENLEISKASPRSRSMHAIERSKTGKIVFDFGEN